MSALLFAGIGLSSPVLAQGGCLNQTFYPAAAITPSNIGLVTVISACNFEQEYSQITGIVTGGTYEFTSSLGSYVTLRSGSFDGGVVAEGVAPLQYVAADNSLDNPAFIAGMVESLHNDGYTRPALLLAEHARSVANIRISNPDGSPQSRANSSPTPPTPSH